MNNLQRILEGCLNSNTVMACQNQLNQYSYNPNFLTQLLQMVPNQTPQLLAMILSTLKNYCTQKYTHPSPQERIPDSQKDVLRNHLFSFFYEINHNQAAINLFKEVLFLVLSQDYEEYQGLFLNMLKNDLDGSIIASVYFCRQLVRVYQYKNGDSRLPLEQFINNWFPSIQGLIQKIMSNYNDQTMKLLEELLCMFYEAFHVDLPEYLRNFSNFDKWLMYFRTILQAPVNNFPNNHIRASRIYVKIISMCCFDTTDGKNYRGWSAQFRSKYGSRLYEDIINILTNPYGGEQMIANIVTCIYYICRNPEFRNIIQQDHCQHIIYKYLLPFMQSNSQDDDYFYNDGLEYIRRSQDLTCHPFRRSALDLIQIIMTNLHFGNKSELIKFVEHSAQVLGSNSNDKQKEVILLVLTQLNHKFMKNQYLKENFQNLVVQYFIPLLKSQNPIVVSQTMKLLSEYLIMATLSPATITQLLADLYNQMSGNLLVLKYHAILAFTKLLDNQQALQPVRPHFKNILEIYVKMLESIDHQNLIKSLEKVIKVFSNEIVNFADNLSDHLFSLFYQLHNKEDKDAEDDEQAFNQIISPLSTISQISQCPLSPNTYLKISQNVMILLKGINDEYNDYIDEILKLLNALVYRGPAIVDYELPYLLCRKMLQGKNQLLFSSGRPSNSSTEELVCHAAKADYQYEDTLLSIIKNCIQKMPEQMLHHYTYPTHPQLLLCLIENNKLNPQTLNNLNTSEVNQQWSFVLQSYTAVVYNIGEVSNPQSLNLVPGISFYPWIEYRLGPDIIKRVLFVVGEDQEQDDEYYEENTAQMLMKYAQDDEEQDNDDFCPDFQNSNYSQSYCSPFDSKKDASHLIAKLKQIPQNQLANMIQQLNPSVKKKLESLFNEY